MRTLRTKMTLSEVRGQKSESVIHPLSSVICPLPSVICPLFSDVSHNSNRKGPATPVRIRPAVGGVAAIQIRLSAFGQCSR